MSFDDVVKAMKITGDSLNEKCKENSLGGLADFAAQAKPNKVLGDTIFDQFLAGELHNGGFSAPPKSGKYLDDVFGMVETVHPGKIFFSFV